MASQRLSARREASLKYRPDIDGLRAIAVSGVVLYHLQSVDILPGGFLGVDVFFVISGFLITSLILPSIQDGTFSFKNFYLRRARRLLPAFAVVALATVAVSWLVLEPSRMLDFTNSLFFAVFGLSNMYFMFQDPYWADSASTLPFLHTWSLGVEEQFYLVFPALLVVATKFLGKHSRVALFSLLGVLSLLLAWWVSGFNPTYAFFLFPTRAWELLVGVLLALVLHHWKILVPKGIAALSAGLGLLLIGVSYLYLGQFITAPSLLTTVPVVGATLIIFGGLTSNPVSQGLGIRPLAGLGLISYSLYLWHYPILALSKVFFSFGAKAEFLSVGLAGCLAIATYFLIETPLRHARWNPGFKIVVPSIVTLLLVFVSFSIPTSGYEKRSTIPQPVDAHSLIEVEYLNTVRGGGHLGSILIFGDSHMGTLVPSLSTLSADNGFDFGNGVIHSCLLVQGLFRAESEGLADGGCNVQWQEDRIAWAGVSGPSFVILGGRFPLVLEGTRFDNLEGGVEPNGPQYNFWEPGTHDFSLENQKAQLEISMQRTTSTLLDQGHVVILVYPIPEAGWDVPLEVKRRNLVGLGAWPLKEPVTTDYDVYLDRTRSTFDLFDEISGNRIIRVYPHRIFCDEEGGGRCMTHDERSLFYIDDDHLSASGARLVTTQIMKEILSWDPPP